MVTVATAMNRSWSR